MVGATVYRWGGLAARTLLGVFWRGDGTDL